MPAPSRKSIVLSISLPSELRQDALRLASREERSFSSLVAVALRRYLRAAEKRRPGFPSRPGENDARP